MYLYNKILISGILLYLSLDFAHQHELMDVGFCRHWDLLFIIQRWPVTTCKIFLSKGKDHHCNLPKNKDMWTIHGLWPTRLGTDHPTTCNASWPLNREEVKPLESELKEHWTNIHKDDDEYKLWSMEWLDRGTCATLEPLNTQYKYFKKGLELNKQYPIFDMLKEANIHPDDTKKVTVEELSNAIKAKTGKIAVSYCQNANETQYLMEIFICLDKKLDVVDCDGVVVTRGILTLCDVYRDIIYPKTI